MKLRLQLRQGDCGWLALATGVVVYELIAEDGELLSEAVDRYLVRRPALTRLAIFITALHLANAIPSRWDPFTAAFIWLRRR